MITTLAIASWDAFGSIIWGTCNLVQQKMGMVAAVAGTLAGLAGVGIVWAKLWNKNWSFLRAKLGELVALGGLSIVMVIAVMTMAGLGLGDAQNYRGDNIISGTANVSTLNGSAFSTLRKMLLNNCEDKEILQIFQAGNKKVKVDAEDPKLNINPQSPNEKALTNWARSEMTKALDAWKNAFNVALYVAIGAFVLYLVAIGLFAYYDIKVLEYYTKAEEEEALAEDAESENTDDGNSDEGDDE